MTDRTFSNRFMMEVKLTYSDIDEIRRFCVISAGELRPRYIRNTNVSRVVDRKTTKERGKIIVRMYRTHRAGII